MSTSSPSPPFPTGFQVLSLPPRSLHPDPSSPLTCAHLAPRSQFTHSPPFAWYIAVVPQLVSLSLVHLLFWSQNDLPKILSGQVTFLPKTFSVSNLPSECPVLLSLLHRFLTVHLSALVLPVPNLHLKKAEALIYQQKSV